MEIERIVSLIREGDVITHTRCMGCVEEHVFTRMNGRWLCGIPTRDTKIISRMSGKRKNNEVNDISTKCITHINRVPVDCVEFLAVTLGPYK
jgi:hypothetical protein